MKMRSGASLRSCAGEPLHERTKVATIERTLEGFISNPRQVHRDKSTSSICRIFSRQIEEVDLSRLNPLPSQTTCHQNDSRRFNLLDENNLEHRPTVRIIKGCNR